MMDMYEFFRQCEEEGLPASEAMDEWQKIEAEEAARFYEEYNSDPLVCAGWAQQDTIDMYRRER